MGVNGVEEASVCGRLELVFPTVTVMFFSVAQGGAPLSSAVTVSLYTVLVRNYFTEIMPVVGSIVKASLLEIL